MSNYNWTNEQKSAIYENGTDLLVSAAAGSGKTAVLTERIIQKLINDDTPVDITDFLIVTFTVSATTELREKLGKAIKEAYNNNKSLKRLKRQILNLPSAKILTIDSFCKFIVSECAKELSIPADFKTGEENELIQLENEVLSETLDLYFNGYEGEDTFDTSFLPSETQYTFFDVVDAFATQKSFSSLNEIILDLFKKLQKYPEPILRARFYLREQEKILKEYYLNNSNPSFFNTSLGALIIKEIKEKVLVALDCYSKAYEIISQHYDMSEKYLSVISNDVSFCKTVLSSDSQNAIVNLHSFAPLKLPVYKAKSSDEADSQEQFKLYRNEGKKLINALIDQYPVLDNERLYLHIAKTYLLSCKLLEIVIEFSKRLWAAKLDQKIFSFDDISQLAYKALVLPNTYDKTNRSFEKTDYAKELQEKFNEILIDEYQDVNELQDTIFRAISNSHNRFMVGDLKQSIYKFRGATPEIFNEYRNTFAPISSTDDSPRLISLQNNFRSDCNVISLVNTLFDVVMNYKSDNTYKKEDHLVFSKTQDLNLPTEISIFDEDVEYQYVADKIIDIVTNSDFSLSDIAVIARKHDSLQQIQKVLSERRIPTDYTPTENFFSSFEIHIIHSLLKVIDNPLDDVALLSILSSPIFAFTSLDLINLRNKNKNVDFYFAVRDYSGNEELKEKCDKVIKKLKRWREKSRLLTSESLIWWLCTETSLMSFLKRLNNYDQRRENIYTFYNLASKFEEKEHKGLTKFLSYLDSYIENQSRIIKKSIKQDAVNLMTIHDSKGLEFPICFCISSHSQINRLDERKKVIFSEKFGPAFALKSGKLGGRVNTYLQKAVMAEIREDTIDEELRLLYVALTRAKNQLFITAHTEIDSLKKHLQLSGLSKRSADYFIKNTLTMLKVICIGMLKNETFKSAFDSYNQENVQVTKNGVSVNLYQSYESQFTLYTPMLEEKSVSELSLSKEEIQFSLSKLANKIIVDTPYKISVSNIREGLLDEGAVKSISLARKYPAFMSLESENISSFRGTAMHVFMQFCDFENCVNKGTEHEAERLFKEKFITEEQKNVLNHRSLAAFFTSKLYKQIASSQRVEREKRYTNLIPSHRFYSDENIKRELMNANKNTLIQGVIDCYFVNGNNKIVLIDFKTDNVSLKDGEKLLKERHSKQIKLYKEAIEEIEGIEVELSYIYSFCLSKEIIID